MEEKYNALCVRSVNYGESDKMLTLFTLEKGLVSCKLAGARKAKAKLRFAGEPFCFAEYVLTEKQDRRTVIEAEEIDEFYGIRTDLTRFYCANVVLEYIRVFLVENSSEYGIFSQAITALKGIEESDCLLFLDWFLISALKESGYGIEDFHCAVCNKKIENRAFIDFDSSQFFCEEHYTLASTEIRFSTYELLSILSSLNIDDMKSIFSPDAQNGENSRLSTYRRAFDNESAKRSALKMLDYYIEVKTGCALKTIGQLLDNV